MYEVQTRNDSRWRKNSVSSANGQPNSIQVMTCKFSKRIEREDDKVMPNQENEQLRIGIRRPCNGPIWSSRRSVYRQRGLNERSAYVGKGSGNIEYQRDCQTLGGKGYGTMIMVGLVSGWALDDLGACRETACTWHPSCQRLKVCWSPEAGPSVAV